MIVVLCESVVLKLPQGYKINCFFQFAQVKLHFKSDFVLESRNKMLNGKFYTGLPENMMNRGPNGIDRQKTNMYWPDEENSPSIHEYSPSRRRSSNHDHSSRTSSISHDSQNSLEDVSAREMVRKQHESKIKFYDYGDSQLPPSRTITATSVAQTSRDSSDVDCSQLKLQALKSRIEFYDFVGEDNTTHNPTGLYSMVNKQSTTKTKEHSRDNALQQAHSHSDLADGHNLAAKIHSDSNTDTFYHPNGWSPHGQNRDQSNNQMVVKPTVSSTALVDKNKKSLQNKLQTPSEIDISCVDLNLVKNSVVDTQTTFPRYSRHNSRETEPEPPNEARKMAHRHLHSNISFGSTTSAQTNTRKPASIRESAVCRVGVGLPDL